MSKKRPDGQYRRVIIHWRDSVQAKRVWYNNDELEQLGQQFDSDGMTSVGYIVKETKHVFILATSIHWEDNDPVGFGSLFSIPKGCVIGKPLPI